MPLDAPTSVEDENHKTFTFRIEVRMIRDMRSPVSGCLVRCFAPFHIFRHRTFSKGNNFPFLRLGWELNRLDNLIDGLWSDCGASRRGEVFRRVHFFAFRFEGAGLLSSPPLPERAAPLRTKGTRPRPRRRAAEHQQLSDGRRTSQNSFSSAGTMLRGATRGAGAGGMNTTEISSADGRCH